MIRALAARLGAAAHREPASGLFGRVPVYLDHFNFHGLWVHPAIRHPTFDLVYCECDFFDATNLKHTHWAFNGSAGAYNARASSTQIYASLQRTCVFTHTVRLTGAVAGWHVD